MTVKPRQLKFILQCLPLEVPHKLSGGRGHLLASGDAARSPLQTAQERDDSSQGICAGHASVWIWPVSDCVWKGTSHPLVWDQELVINHCRWETEGGVVNAGCFAWYWRWAAFYHFYLSLRQTEQTGLMRRNWWMFNDGWSILCVCPLLIARSHWHPGQMLELVGRCRG